MASSPSGTTRETSGIRFDAATASFADDPYPVYRRLRDEFPVYEYRNGDGPAWCLSRFADVNTALADWQTFSSVGSMDLGRSPVGHGHANQLITTDPPLHDAIRRVVKEYLSPRRVQLLATRVSEAVTTRLSQLRGAATLDIAGEFAWPLTLEVISDIIGIPESDRRSVLRMYQDLEYSSVAERASDALVRYTEYFENLGRERLSHPRHDLMSEMMRAVAGGDISWPDAMTLCKDLVEGGVDVPANLISNSVLALSDLPAQRAHIVAVKSDTIRLGHAVDELARYDSPIQRIPRITTRDVDCHGLVIPQGAKVLLLLGSANRDERRFDRPDTVDLTRRPLRNLAFGAGIHFCIGAPLARLEARIALPELCAALPRYEVVSPIMRPRGSPVMRALLHLPVLATR